MNVNAEKLTSYLRGKHRDVQERVFEYFNSRPDLQTPIEILKDDYRELCMRQLVGLVREAGIRPFRYVVEDLSMYFAIIEAGGSVDTSLGIKLGVQYSLWGGSVLNLGTKKHRDKYFEEIDNLEYLDCFAMTELHHDKIGSLSEAREIIKAARQHVKRTFPNLPQHQACLDVIEEGIVHGGYAGVLKGIGG